MVPPKGETHRCTATGIILSAKVSAVRLDNLMADGEPIPMPFFFVVKKGSNNFANFSLEKPGP